MKKLFLLLLLSYASTSNAQELTWLTNFTKAKHEARQTDKMILMRFTGSDWCANCIRIDTTLIETTQFEEFTKNKYVFLYLDFPSKPSNALPHRQARHNQELLEKYNPAKSFPALLVLDKNGGVLGQMNVKPNTTDGYIELLQAISK